MYVFVYGSLRRGERNPIEQFLPNQVQFIGKGWIKGDVYQIDWYPGLVNVHTSESIVYGEIYEILDPKAMTKLDAYEGIGTDETLPYLYKREMVNVNLLDGKTINAWVYIYNMSLPKNARKIN